MESDSSHVPSAFPPVTDGHVHLFPDRVFEALWRWFEKHAWPIQYKIYSAAVLDFLHSRGVAHVVALHYSHKPGMARALNQYMAEIVRGRNDVTGVATVLPGEPDAAAILEEGFALGLRGVKLHCHVQRFAADSEAMDEIYALCERRQMPVIIHAGRGPRTPGYGVDTDTLCGVERMEAALRSYPKLRITVPHLGFDEIPAYLKLLERYDNLWLDTTMAIAEYFPGEIPWDLIATHHERIIYGSDFPNLPYAWDRELVKLAERKLSPDALESICGNSIRALFEAV